MIIADWDSSKHPPLVIAELSANHNHQLTIAIDTIKAAKQAGADAIKFQTYTADTITLKSDKEYFKIDQGTIWDGKYLHDLYQEAYTPWEWHEELFKVAKQEGLICFSSPFDPTAVDLLETLKTPAYKIASFEITDIPLIRYAASKGKPMIISTGIGTKEEIQDAINACKNEGNDQITLLKCTSSYPAPIDQADLLTMVDFKKQFGMEVGLSDHTIGNEVAIAATALGATIIEKHFILDRSIGGPDASFSLDPEQFKSMAAGVKNAYAALGQVDYELSEQKIKSRKFKRSLFVVAPIKKGEPFTSENIRSIRPGDGLDPKHYDNILGKTASKDLEEGEPLKEGDILGN